MKVSPAACAFRRQRYSNNDFHVVDQYVGRNADGDVFRPDLLLFVNGLPLAIIECKASHHRLDEAHQRQPRPLRGRPRAADRGRAAAGLGAHR